VLTAAVRIGEAGYSVRVIDPRWVTPIPDAVLEFAQQAELVVTVEDGVVVNGVGSRLSQQVRERGLVAQTREIGIPVEFLDHGKVADVRARIGLTAQGISRRTIEFAAAVLGRGEPGSEVHGGSPEMSANAEKRRD
jgi:1-deoxy-D-xylulose-5-phosphate synthase